MAMAIRRTKFSSHIPIIFVDGEPEKVEAFASICPTRLSQRANSFVARIGPLARIPWRIPGATVVMERYGPRTKAQKLGIKDVNVVAVIDPPRTTKRPLGIFRKESI